MSYPRVCNGQQKKNSRLRLSIIMEQPCLLSMKVLLRSFQWRTFEKLPWEMNKYANQKKKFGWILLEMLGIGRMIWLYCLEVLDHFQSSGIDPAHLARRLWSPWLEQPQAQLQHISGLQIRWVSKRISMSLIQRLPMIFFLVWISLKKLLSIHDFIGLRKERVKEFTLIVVDLFIILHSALEITLRLNVFWI